MPRLTWGDGETHEFVVIGKEASKRHFDRKNKRFIPCTGREKCWWCSHGYDYQGVVIGIAIYTPEEVDGSHFPWLSLTPNAYRAIKRVLGLTKNWYGHKIALTREGVSFDTRYEAEDLGKEKKTDLILWQKKREEEIIFDAGEEWGEEPPEEKERVDEEVVLERAIEPEEDEEGRRVYLEELIKSAQTELEELEEGE